MFGVLMSVTLYHAVKVICGSAKCRCLRSLQLQGLPDLLTRYNVACDSRHLNSVDKCSLKFGKESPCLCSNLKSVIAHVFLQISIVTLLTLSTARDRPPILQVCSNDHCRHLIGVSDVLRACSAALAEFWAPSRWR